METEQEDGAVTATTRHQDESGEIPTLGEDLETAQEVEMYVLAHGLALDTEITVCAECNRACCWAGEFMCEHADIADVKDMNVTELIKLWDANECEEHPYYWIKAAHENGKLINVVDANFLVGKIRKLEGLYCETMMRAANLSCELRLEKQKFGFTKRALASLCQSLEDWRDHQAELYAEFGNESYEWTPQVGGVRELDEMLLRAKAVLRG